MKLLVSHPTLNANSKNLVTGLLKEQQLFKLFTSIAIFPGQLLFKLGNNPKLKDLQRRSLDETWQPYTRSRSFFEFGRLLTSKFKLDFLITHEKGFFCIDKVYQKHDKWVADNLAELKKEGLLGVYAYEDGALSTFKAAKQLGLYCIYDLPIGYWKSARLLMQKEFDINPAWSDTLTGFNDSLGKLSKKDEELALADVIFVASSFTKKTLENYKGNLPEIKVIPYGFPAVTRKKYYEPLLDRKLKILFIGGLSQRKGISYLFDAVEKMEDKVELTIVGHKAISNCEALNLALEKHNWIPSLSHDEVLECMYEHDVFVFPSLFEGFGLVITEAMSQGIPVITTNRTAGPDLIEHGKDGWIVPAGSSKAIKEVIIQILEKPEILEQFGFAAQNKAQTRPWSVYGKEMSDALSSLKDFVNN
ncbi:glycosyl transferase family 1 [Flavobacterium sp. WLB]|uniref:glycosyltransferase family 4 protein n=1 Tax=unclassified Flavobacterium TaxID=196869 RepID=UPI0006ABCD42|nr:MULTISPECIES: glycosyltransferase family 4 protein [unclassified Flavobacterium]KOP39980.1 glycosyl transferase family 1 [Flavobacterium sp. VMW]OWU88487.1 glycosyl transferase family 1 [Flavobacterium sp. NLM]PUU69277.1 glycosyl transferase family 1 [Flavobacterium sp. WLB]